MDYMPPGDEDKEKSLGITQTKVLSVSSRLQ